MARIRTIKPEFPQSESIGRLSRDARLLFVQLWTIVDDAGRTRAASRMLASLLYPYDDDARGLMDGWLDELERQGHIRRYEVDGTHYLEICKWLEHQKIDRPSPSRLPEYREPSTNPREPSRALAADLGPRTLDLGPRKDDDAEDARARDPLIRPEAISLSNEIAELCGHDLKFVPPAWCGASMRVEAWLANGWTRGQILPAVQATLAKKRGKPPDSINYFEKPIAEFIATMARPLPEVVVDNTAEKVHVRPATGSSIIAAADRLVEQLEHFDEPAPGGDLRGGAGPPAVRAIPQR